MEPSDAKPKPYLVKPKSGRKRKDPDGSMPQISCRFPLSQVQFIEQGVRETGLTESELMRSLLPTIGALQAEVMRLKADLEVVTQQRDHPPTDDDLSIAFVRMLSCRALTRTGEGAFMTYIERYPTDAQVPLIRRLLERFRACNAASPGSVTDDDLWGSLLGRRRELGTK